MELTQTLQQVTQNDIDAIICEKSLYEFVIQAWPFADPAPYVDDWHIKVICKKLEGVYNGDIKRLVINIPPRCSKSLICSVFFPVWCWVKNPQLKFMTGSYAGNLSTRDTLKSRMLIQSHWFQTLWPGLIQFAPDQNQKTCYANTAKGERISFSVGGALTGSGADIIIIDDPINAKFAYSKTVRDSCNSVFSQAISTRLNNPREGAIIIIMQRLHEDDLSGFVLKGGSWEHLCIPMRYELPGNPYDIRKKENTILTKKESEKTLKALEDVLGPYGVASQLQQHPAPKGGGIIKFDWFEYYDTIPNIIKGYTWSWDTAIKVGEHNDYSVGTLWDECEDGHYLVDMWRDKKEYPEVKQKVKALNEISKAKEILIEDKSSGQQLVQEFRRIGSNMTIKPMMPGRNMPSTKEERLQFVSTFFHAGKVKFPKNKPWMKDVEYELLNFPNASHDDIVDSISQYLCRQLTYGDDLYISVI